jgi:hypothetical protein
LNVSFYFADPLDGTTLSKNLLIILAIGMCVMACHKNYINEPEACAIQTANPDHRVYSSSEFSVTNYTGKNCGLISLSPKHYWVYLDSIFDNGNFITTRLDTLRFLKTYQTQPDELIWWEANKSVGLPAKCYANDTSIFSLEPRLFTSFAILDARKEIFRFTQDSLKFLTSFGDEAAIGRALHCDYSTQAGNFHDCLFFEKYAMMYRRDQVYLQPGVGVVKYIHEEAPIGYNQIQMQQISTLVGFHIQ